MADGFDFTQLPTEPRARLAAALAHLETLRDEMIAELDRLEGDPDFEPSLGAPERHPAVYNVFDLRRSSQDLWSAGGDGDEREDVCEDEGGACEDEGHDSDREADYADHG
ncbi:MAG: hypothetical protein WAP03_13640 [Methylorubrum rhodinum]|uniref:hypothetical protein n=1 Tax=Methylorubrum rhodinum TaxID=29428 RepID=UPI003BB08A64